MNDLDKKELKKIYEEGYGFFWKGKGKAKEDSINMEKDYIPFTKENLYIEGDNLVALKQLEEEWKGKVKMIYIDPPYNTNKKFVYSDKFKKKKKDSLSIGDQLHSNWLNMMYPRIKLSRELLKEDGVIFVSIGDNEQSNLCKLLNEIFGELNKVGEFIVVKSEGGGMAKQVNKGHDYLYVYAKDISKFTPLKKPKNIRGKTVEVKGEKYWVQEDWLRREFGKYGNCYYEEILTIKGKEKLKEIKDGLKNGEYTLVPKNNGMHVVGKLRNINLDSSNFYSILKHLSANGVKDLKEIGMNKFFDYPKPISLVKELILGSTFFSRKNKDIILDFFSGSATTAHAVMELNAEDRGNRKFILVQSPYPINEKTKAYQVGYTTICDVGRERIKRAGKLIKNNDKLPKENREKLNTDFKVIKV